MGGGASARKSFPVNQPVVGERVSWRQRPLSPPLSVSHTAKAGSHQDCYEHQDCDDKRLHRVGLVYHLVSFQHTAARVCLCILQMLLVLNFACWGESICAVLSPPVLGLSEW